MAGLSPLLDAGSAQTSNRGLGDWSQVIADPGVYTAILHRLLHHATVVSIKGATYGMRATFSQPGRPLL